MVELKEDIVVNKQASTDILINQGLLAIKIFRNLDLH